MKELPIIPNLGIVVIVKDCLMKSIIWGKITTPEELSERRNNENDQYSSPTNYFYGLWLYLHLMEA